MAFNEEIGQFVLIRAGNGQTNIVTSPGLCAHRPFYPLIHLFSHACSSLGDLDPAIPTFDSSHKYPKISVMQSPNALPLHPTVCPCAPWPGVTESFSHGLLMLGILHLAHGDEVHLGGLF